LIRVSASALDILWTDLGHARPPEPLSLRSVGGTHEERADIRQAVYDNLADRGLFRDGLLDPALQIRLDTLATGNSYVECEALADMAAETPFRAVAASRGKQAVLATQPSQTIALSSIRESEVLSAIVDLLPELRPGPGYGVSMPAAALGGAVEDPVFGDRPASGRSGSRDRQISEVLAIQARPVGELPGLRSIYRHWLPRPLARHRAQHLVQDVAATSRRQREHRPHPERKSPRCRRPKMRATTMILPMATSCERIMRLRKTDFAISWGSFRVIVSLPKHNIGLARACSSASAIATRPRRS